MQKEMTKGKLSELAGVHYAQIGRYEEKGARPSSEVLGRLANALDTTTDYGTPVCLDRKAKFFS